MSEHNVNWGKIHTVVIYDPNMMKPSKEIDHAIYSIGGKEFYTPILKFCEDIGDDNVYMECYLDRASVEVRSFNSTLARGPLNTSEYRVRVSFPKDKFSELLVRSIGADKYIWEDESFQKILVDVFNDLASHLTSKTGHLFICSFQRYILSGGTGTILTKTGEMAGCFSGLIIEPSKTETSINAASGKRTSQPSLRVIVPRLQFNHTHFSIADCRFVYTDPRNALKISAPMSMFLQHDKSGPHTNILQNMIFEKLSSGTRPCIPNEDYSELMNKKLILPHTKFEYRLAMLNTKSPTTRVQRVSAISEGLRSRFKELVKE